MVAVTVIVVALTTLSVLSSAHAVYVAYQARADADRALQRARRAKEIARGRR